MFRRIVEEVLIFGNPIAGRGQGQRIAARLAKRLASDGYGVQAVLKPPDTLERDAVIRPKTRAVIAIGGDGTLRAVVDRLVHECMAAKCVIPPILVVPLGTANLMGRHLGVKWESRTMDAAISRAIKQR